MKSTYTDTPPHGAKIIPYAPLVPILQGNYRAGRVVKPPRAGGAVIRGGIEAKGGGWFHGFATLGGKQVYRSRALRGHDAAWAFAREAMALIRTGLEVH